MKIWTVKFWVNEPEYKSAVHITANSVEKTSDQSVRADGVEIVFDENITEIEFVSDPALDDPSE